MSPAEQRQLRRWLRGDSREAPQWHFILEAAGYDPLRAQEIEDRVSKTWWDRWFIDREERIAAAPRPASNRAPPTTAQHPSVAALTRARYELFPDGQLRPVATP